MNETYPVLDQAKTDKLYCTGCKKKIKKGEDVVFEVYKHKPRGKKIQ